MMLYHGTTERHLEAILRDGLKPRGKTDGNWKHTITSNAKAVYLTNSYALHYAHCAVGNAGGRMLILEIDSDRLAPWLFTPDEDFLEQATRKSKQEIIDIHGKVLAPGLPMKKRTLWFRNRLQQFSHAWKDSIEHLGNCCYFGNIPARAITRYALVPQSGPLAWASDPTITLLNYIVMGGYYRELTRHVFGETVDQSLGLPEQMKRMAEIPRDGVEITTMVHPQKVPA